MTSSASSATVLDLAASRAGSAGAAGAIRAGSVLLIAALTAAAAQVSVPLPFTQVPFTFQPMIVLLGGLALGPRLGMASQLVYLLAGAAGLPVFALSPVLPPGALRLLGPTGGYLLAYPAAAYLVGYLAVRGFDRRYLTSVLAMAAGLVVVYASGTLWLAYLARSAAGSASVGLQAALAGGVYPFVAADILKLLAAAAVLPGVWRLIGRTDTR